MAGLFLLLTGTHAETVRLEQNETVYQISKRYGIPLEVLLQSNSIDDPTDLPVGRAIVIPGDAADSGNKNAAVHAADTRETVAAAPAYVKKYTVEKGDTLYFIASKTNTSVRQLKQVNELTDTDVIIAGATLVIPDDAADSDDKNAAVRAADTRETVAAAPAHVKKYTVEKGDTLYSIASKTNTSVRQLKQVNELTDTDIIIAGATLGIPDSDAMPNGQKKQNHNPQGVIVGYADKPILSASAGNILREAPENRVKKPVKNPPWSSASIAAVSSGFDTINKSASTNDALLDKATPLGVVSKQFPVRNGTPYALKKDSGVYIESAINSEVRAVADGVVLYVASYGTLQHVVIVQSKHGETFVYGGQGSIRVKQGDVVSKGQIVGTVGLMPLVKKPVLYFAVLLKDKFINPEKFIL